MKRLGCQVGMLTGSREGKHVQLEAGGKAEEKVARLVDYYDR